MNVKNSEKAYLIQECTTDSEELMYHQVRASSSCSAPPDLLLVSDRENNIPLRSPVVNIITTSTNASGSSQKHQQHHHQQLQHQQHIPQQLQNGTKDTTSKHLKMNSKNSSKLVNTNTSTPQQTLQQHQHQQQDEVDGPQQSQHQRHSQPPHNKDERIRLEVFYNYYAMLTFTTLAAVDGAAVCHVRMGMTIATFPHSLRRMFPSLRLSLSGLEEEANYCVLLEMVPIGDCRYKFSGSQWVPAGGAEPQSPQRMYLHPDSPASGAHWQAQPILFNKVKLTNNTLDNNGHIVLASMHKYQPRIHIIRTADLTQIPWAPQQAFLFPETEFVAVTAYQNDRITKLKIDNNPFAKGFRETGQSRCKRKMSSSPSNEDHDNNMQQEGQQQRLLQQQQSDLSPMKSNSTTNSSDSVPSICFDKTALGALPETNDFEISQQIKRIKSNGSACSTTSQEEINIISDCKNVLNALNLENW
ncbi:T-box transcription factor TBX5-like [Teleopsis dalmanni]|uniref:T-box transcription factor TBX5-like n=1 Tax=Teleopsis dalmanni TaxID=139649 RepID=UPI0018CFCEDF|nr:T-box transcription factor TBX5-like [Teleopsis dalmanni]